MLPLLLRQRAPNMFANHRGVTTELGTVCLGSAQHFRHETPDVFDMLGRNVREQGGQ